MGMLKEFREFAMKGNVVDLAVAVIIGTAFGKIVTELNATIIMPLLSMVMGKGGVDYLETTINGTVLPYGKFLQAVIDFMLVAFVLFLIVKGMNSFKKKEPAPPPAPPSEEVTLLREIRDALKK